MRYEIRPLGAWTDPETKPRQPHPFKATWQVTLDLLGRETRLLGAKLVVIQVDATEADIRRDGMLRADAKVGHPGVIISFESKFGPLRYAADTYAGRYGMPGWQANVRAVALSLEALRAVDRWGATHRGEQYQGWTAIESPKPEFDSWRQAAGWMREYALTELRILLDPGSDYTSLYRAMAAKMHPDRGGPRADWDRLAEARRMLIEAGMMRP
jgi:hypothetical protein